MKKSYPAAVRGIQTVRADGDIKEVIAGLQKAWHEFKADNDRRLAEVEKKGNADPLLAEKVDKINAEVSNLSAMKKQIEELETMASRPGGFGGGESELDKAKAEHRQAFDQLFRRGVDNGLRDLEVKAALTTQSDPDGGYLAPAEYEKAIDRVLKTMTAMRRLARVQPISAAAYKKLMNVGGATSGWVGEEDSRPQTSTPTLKEIVINAHEVYVNMAATQTTLDDASIDIGQWLEEEGTLEMEEEEGAAFISGNGIKKPRGILAYDTVANASYAWGKLGFVVSGSASALTDSDKLISLQHALKAGYRNNSAFLMADTTLETVRKLKDTTGAYIWRPGLEAGAPSLLLGKPVETDDNMPAIAANALAIAYGDFRRGYMIADRVGIRVLRDPFTAKPYVLFYMTKRVGGGVTNFEAIKLLKIAA
ncbi:MAG: phage major capsid protein [Thermodesulfobacteriota bacterium]|jgi:HK97 family phage major capsid protein